MTKKLEEKTIDSYSSYVRLFGFYTQQNVNSTANFVFTPKTGLPRVVLMLRWVLFVPEIFLSPLSEFEQRMTSLLRVVLMLRWVLFVPEIFVSPLSEFEQRMYSSDPRPDTSSLIQLESRRAVPQASQLP